MDHNASTWYFMCFLQWTCAPVIVILTSAYVHRPKRSFHSELGENSTATADEHLGRPMVSDSLSLVGTNRHVHFFIYWSKYHTMVIRW
jgi:hypothetical protein